MLLVSADSHVIEDGDLWVNNLPGRFADCAPRFSEQKRGAFETRGSDAGSDPSLREQAMIADGVSGEVLYPSLALDLFGMGDAGVQEQCFRVYNDWLADYCAVAPDRLHGIALIPTFSIERSVDELHHALDIGLRGAMVWQVPPDGLSFATRHYDPLWAAAQEAEVPISFHILTGFRHPWPFDFPPGRSLRDVVSEAVNTKTLDAANLLADLITSGAFERFPGLRAVLVENEVSWIPFYLAQYDKYAQRAHPSEAKLLPSEYFARQCYATFFNDEPGRYIFGEWGTDNLMWSNDFPHANSTWPNSLDVIARDLGHLDADARVKLTSGNALALYNLAPPNEAVTP